MSHIGGNRNIPSLKSTSAVEHLALRRLNLLKNKLRKLPKLNSENVTILHMRRPSYMTTYLKYQKNKHILWEQPSLNSQLKHLNLSLSYELVSFLSFLSFFCFFRFLPSSLIILINISLCYTTYRTISLYFLLCN